MSDEGLKIKIVLVEDDKRFASEVEKILSPDYTILVANDATEGHRLISQVRPDLLLLDQGLPTLSGLEVLKILRRRLPDLPIIMLTGESGPETIIETMKAGANDYIIKSSEDLDSHLKFRISQTLERSALQKRNQQLAAENNSQIEKNKRLSAKLEVQARAYEILGNEEVILKLKRDILRLKGTNAFVLITGENGTGKELVARALNSQEDDSARPFVAVNCAAISANLFESEFFGHVKGSFTGATENKYGLFKMADGGDIFLDEVGEIPLAMQAKLLRVLQEKTFTPVGAVKQITVDVRVIAATNRNLEEEVQKGNFREDLYYRLTRIILRTPALRERKGDIVHLAEEFLKRLLPTARLTEPAKKALIAHSWKGNIRELQNTIERATVLMKDASRPVLKPEHLNLIATPAILERTMQMPDQLLPQSKEQISGEHRQLALDWIDRLYWERALKIAGENRALYSMLGISKTHYYERKRELFTDQKSQEVNGI